MIKGNGGGSLRRFYAIFGVIALGALGAVGYSVVSKAQGAAVSEPVDMEGLDDMQRLAELAVPVNLGSEDAPATIIVFEDYLCNHCSAFSLQVKPRLEAAFIETGEARLVYYDYPLNPQLGSFLAARAARCAGDQDRFWDYHNRLMRNQMTWGRVQNKIPAFEDYAEELGLDRAEFSKCLNSDAHAEEVTANRELARALGLPGTPTIMVGSGTGMSRRLPDYAFQSIQDAIEALKGG